MSHLIAAAPARLPRRLVLGTALLLALLVSLPPKSPDANAQNAALPSTSAPAATSAPQGSPPSTAPTAPTKASVDDGAHGIAIKIAVTPGEDAAKAPEDKGTDDAVAAEREAPGTITIKKNGKTVKITGVPKDREFDSVGQFIHHEPELAGMVVAVVAIVFMAPVLAIALVIWYRIRKTRMLNETMLKLAEKGVVAPADALEAIASGTSPRDFPTGQSAGAPATLRDQASDMRKRAAWSDLRKGVIMGAIGLGIASYSLLRDRFPNVFALVLLFVGIGYVALWWFEERQVTPVARANGASPSSDTNSGDAGSGGAP